MTNYPYEMQLVVDPSNPRNVVAGGSVSIYDSADTGHTTLLTLTDPNGVPITNPIVSNSNGFTEPFVTTSPQVLWVSGEYVDYFNSYVGMRNEAVAAKVAAESAAATAGEVSETLPNLYVRFRDTSGNPIDGKLVTIVVDTALSEIADIIVEVI